MPATRSLSMASSAPPGPAGIPAFNHRGTNIFGNSIFGNFRRRDRCRQPVPAGLTGATDTSITGTYLGPETFFPASNSSRPRTPTGSTTPKGRTFLGTKM